MQFIEINREYIYKLKEELGLSLSKVVNMLITVSRNRLQKGFLVFRFPNLVLSDCTYYSLSKVLRQPKS